MTCARAAPSSSLLSIDNASFPAREVRLEVNRDGCLDCHGFLPICVPRVAGTAQDCEGTPTGLPRFSALSANGGEHAPLGVYREPKNDPVQSAKICRTPTRDSLGSRRAPDERPPDGLDLASGRPARISAAPSQRTTSGAWAAAFERDLRCEKFLYSFKVGLRPARRPPAVRPVLAPLRSGRSSTALSPPTR